MTRVGRRPSCRRRPGHRRRQRLAPAPRRVPGADRRAGPAAPGLLRRGRGGAGGVSGGAGGVGAGRTAEQRVDQLAGGRPSRRVLGQRGLNQPAQRPGQPAQIRRPVQDPVRLLGRRQRRAGLRVRPRVVSGRRVRHQAAPAEHVRRRTDRPVAELLRRHPARRADQHPGLGVPLGHLERAGDAEIDHPRPGQRQQHVGRLQVTVHDPGSVHRRQRRRHSERDPVQRGLVQRAAVRHRDAQGHAVHELGDQVRRSR